MLYDGWVALADPRLMQLVPQQTIAVRVQVPMAELKMRALLDSHRLRLFQYASSRGVFVNGPLYARSFEFGPERADIEIGFPVAGHPRGLAALARLPAGEVGTSSLPGGAVAMTLHQGPYKALGEAHRHLQDWIHEQGHQEAPGPWESYLDDPSAVDKSQLRTEIYWPITSATER